jgi:hypothetical protein
MSGAVDLRAVTGVRIGSVVHGLADALPAGWRVQPFGPDGACAVRNEPPTSLIVTRAEHDGIEFVHASIAHPDTHPTYDELTALARWVFGHGWSFQVFAPPTEHVNIHEHALHLWGRADGKAVHPNFGLFGTI